MDEHRGPTLHQLGSDPTAPYWLRTLALELGNVAGDPGRDPVDVANALEQLARACHREVAALERRTFRSRLEEARR